MVMSLQLHGSADCSVLCMLPVNTDSQVHRRHLWQTMTHCSQEMQKVTAGQSIVGEYTLLCPAQHIPQPRPTCAQFPPHSAGPCHW